MFIVYIYAQNKGLEIANDYFSVKDFELELIIYEVLEKKQFLTRRWGGKVDISVCCCFLTGSGEICCRW